jgi:ribonucleoside-triphosphate reductase
VETKTNSSPLYCVELDTDNHLFQIAGGLVTHNCRLRLDLSELKRKGGLFGANPLTGSVSVCTINFPRLGYLHKNDEEGFFKELDELLLLAKEALDVRRKHVEMWTDQGMYPILKFCLRKTHARFQKYWTNHFSTIATVGMNECLLNMCGYGIGDTRGREFALKVMNHLRKKAVEFQVQSGNQYNIEQAPAESTSYRLAKIDKKKYPDIIVADNENVEKEGLAPFYTNSTQLPVNYTDDIFELMDNQAAINSLYTGGSVQHLYLGERVTDLESMKQLIKTIFSNYEIPYISITPTFSVCPTHGYLPGEHKYCPYCKSEKIHKIDLEEERLKALLAKDEQSSVKESQA